MNMVERKHEDTSVRLSFPGRLEFLDLVDNVIAGVNELMRFPEDDATAVSISVIEAGTNAIQHGCKNGADSRVHINFHMHEDRLAVEVHDPGIGFNPESLPDPTSPDNLLKERGRGIFIMRQMMDEIRFDFSNGTTVRMVKRRP
jgi:serine/threonine-protein kinase RsbW